MSPHEWPRADPDALAKFDPATKQCTMNCGPHKADPRSYEERLFLCDECSTIKPLPLTQSATCRGFALVTFQDRYGTKCSLQESSLASERAIWFGVDDAEPKVLASEAPEHGVATEETTGWVPYPIPHQVLLTTRMHLTQKQVKGLLPLLQHFAKTGALPTL